PSPLTRRASWAVHARVCQRRVSPSRTPWSSTRRQRLGARPRCLVEVRATTCGWRDAPLVPDDLDLTPIELDCMRCGRRARMRFAGMCPECRDEVRAKYSGPGRVVEAV